MQTCVTLKIGPCWKKTLGWFFNIKYWPWSKFNVIFWSKVVVEKWSTLNFGQYAGHFLTTARTSDRVKFQHQKMHTSNIFVHKRGVISQHYKMAIRGGGHISTLKNNPKYKNSCRIIFSAKRGGGHISTLKNGHKRGVIFQRWNMTPSLLWPFFNVEIWPHLLCTKNVKCIFGIIFQRWNMTPSPLGRENDSTRNFIFGIIFNVEIWPPPL